MTATVTLSRGGTSVEIPLLETSGGAPVLTTDIGKPELKIWETGTINPRHSDQWSGLQNYVISGRYLGSDAYTRAHSLADLVKSYGGGDPITMDTTVPEFDDGIKTVPAAGQDGALTLGYAAGEAGIVDVDLQLTRVSDVLGSGTQQATTPTASGTGPLELSRDNTTVALTDDVAVSRSVGRPNSSIRRSTDTYPFAVDKRKSASDTFEVRATLTESNVSAINRLAKEIVRPKLGRESLTLDFNGLFGYGSFDVVPTGSQALRHDAPSGFEGVSRVPTIELRRVV